MIRRRLYIPLALTTLLVVMLFVLAMVRLLHNDEVYTPRPYAYLRFDLPDHAYHTVQYGPYGFDLSTHAMIVPKQEPGERYWMNIEYPELNATIHCSYKPVRGDLRLLTKDAMEFVYKHSQQASAIPEHDYSRPRDHVWGVFFTLEGNTASPYQFFLTDSTANFFRGAVYCNCIPNADSLAPILDYMNEDVRVLIESFHWQ